MLFRIEHMVTIPVGQNPPETEFAMADDSKGAYDLEPEDESGDTGSIEAEPSAEASSESPSDPEPTAGDVSEAIPMEPLLDAFDDDEDLESDSEVEDIQSGKKAKRAATKETGTSDNESGNESNGRATLVKDSWDPPRVMFITGGILTLAAIVVTAIYTPDHRILAPLLVLYKIGVHTGTGVVAVIVASMLLHMKTGRLDKAASRVFVAVAAFMLVINFSLDIGRLSSSVQILLSSFVYMILIAWLFRFRRDRLMVVTIAHLALVVIIKVGMVLSTGMAVTGTGG